MINQSKSFLKFKCNLYFYSNNFQAFKLQISKFFFCDQNIFKTFVLDEDETILPWLPFPQSVAFKQNKYICWSWSKNQ